MSPCRRSTRRRARWSFWTAAGGGLSRSDLAELTGSSAWEIQELLRTVAGRSFSRRSAGWGTDPGLEVYVLGHEDIQAQVAGRFGEAGLRGYRDRIHAWAGGYRERGWPSGTPDYLLRGYHRMLHDAGDVRGMVALSTDPARHDRLFSASGADFTALTEIAQVREALLRLAPDDVEALARLAVHRVRITRRAESMVINLPHVWARIGRPDRAESLARSMPDPYQQALALAGLARAVAANGDFARAQQIAESLTVTRWKVYAWTGLAKALAAAGELGRARQLARQAEGGARGVEALASVVEAYAACGDLDRAAHLAAGIDESLDRTAGPVSDWDLAFLTGAMATAGKVARAKELAESIVDHRWRTYALIGLAGGDPPQAPHHLELAESTAAGIRAPTERGFALAPLVSLLAQRGETERAARLAARIEELLASDESGAHQPYAWAELAKAVAVAGDPDRARGYAERAQRAAATLMRMDRELAAIVRPLVALGEVSLAEQVALRIADPNRRGWALTAVAVALAGDAAQARGIVAEARRGVALIDAAEERAEAPAGDAAQARGIVAEARRGVALIDAPEERAEALVAIAEVCLRLGDLPDARTIAEESAAVALDVGDNVVRAWTLASIVRLEAKLGRTDRVREFVARAQEEASGAWPGITVWALAPVIQAVGSVGEPGIALAMAQHAQQLALRQQEGPGRDGELLRLVQALAGVDRDRAKEVAHLMGNPAIMLFAGGVAPILLTGEFDRAEQRLQSALDAGGRGMALAQLARAAAVSGDPSRALRLAIRSTDSLSADPQQLWHTTALLVLVEAMLRIGDHSQAERFAAAIPDPHSQAWTVARVARGDPGRCRAAVAHALRVTDWCPLGIPLLMPDGPEPAELKTGDPMAPTGILASVAPEAVTAIAQELLRLRRSG